MYGAAEESDQEPPAKGQKIQTEAIWAVPGEAICHVWLSDRREAVTGEILRPSPVERRSGARLIPIGLPGRSAARTTASPRQRPTFFMKSPRCATNSV